MKKTVVALLIIILSLQLIHFILINEYIFGKEYRELQDEIQGIKRANIMLQENILTREALTNINAEARRMGFVDGRFIFLKR